MFTELEHCVFPTASFTQKYHILDSLTVCVLVIVCVVGVISVHPLVGSVFEFVNLKYFIPLVVSIPLPVNVIVPFVQPNIFD